MERYVLFIHETVTYSIISLQEHCNEQDTEICSVKVNMPIKNLSVFVANLRSLVPYPENSSTGLSRESVETIQHLYTLLF